MGQMGQILAVIPARGGSKGIPGKNIIPFLGKPLIYWSIEVAQASQWIDRVVVTTDDAEISQIAQYYGAEVPFLRPRKLSTDFVADYPVIRHCLDFLLEEEDYSPSLVVQLRPTSPLRTPELVDDAIQVMLRTKDADSLRVVCESPLTPFKMWRISNEYLEPLVDTDIYEPFNQARQSLPKTYWQIGTIDVINTSTIYTKESLSGEKIVPYVVDQSWISDIDDHESLRKAELACVAKGLVSNL